MEFELRTKEDRRRAFKAILDAITEDLLRGKIPTFHVVETRSDGTVENHFMTPMSLEPIDEKGSRAIWYEDIRFFLKLLLSLKRVVHVEYDPSRAAVIFTYAR